MQVSVHAHGLLELLGAGCVQVPAFGDEPGDLPALVGVTGDECAIDAEVPGQVQRLELGAPIDDLVRADARVPVDVLPVAHGEMTREVRNALLERVEVVHIVLAASQDRGDVLEDLGVEVVHEHGVEAADLIEGVELVDHSRRVLPDDHVELLDVLDVDLLPQLGRRFGQRVDLFENAPEAG